MYELTPEQEAVIQEVGNCVVIANPGSGKTTTISIKIQRVVKTLPEHKGVIAISYTNKASEELYNRSAGYSSNLKSSFFGTIDKCLISEIIIPFGKQVFGLPDHEIQVCALTLDNFSEEQLKFLNGNFTQDLDYEDLTVRQIEVLKRLFLNGKILLPYLGLTALYILDKSSACKKYLKARYTHIFIDEYQDSDKSQHCFFIKVAELGLCAIAVGDTNQSIFRFAGKDPKYLLSLADTHNFKLLTLSRNHRSHNSIVNYSLRLIKDDFELLEADSLNIYHKNITGTQIEIAHWISKVLERFKEKYEVVDNNRIGILVRDKHTAAKLHENLLIKHKLFAATKLEEEVSLWGTIFKNTLELLFNNNKSKYSLVEKHLDLEFERNKTRKIISILSTLSKVEPSELIKSINLFVLLAETIYPNARNTLAIDNLKSILSDVSSLESFREAGKDEIQLMTLHKSKGLEFDIVFHLDLHKWVIPKEKIDQNQVSYTNYYEDLNLHYVGITRAKKALIICTSTQRYNFKGEIKPAEISEFVRKDCLLNLRVNI